MKIAFGVGEDGLTPTQFETRMGEIQVGPLGLLGILETQLGVQV